MAIVGQMARSPWGPEARPNKARPKHMPSTMNLGPGPARAHRWAVPGPQPRQAGRVQARPDNTGPIGPMAGMVGRHGPRPALGFSLLFIDIKDILYMMDELHMYWCQFVIYRYQFVIFC